MVQDFGPPRGKMRLRSNDQPVSISRINDVAIGTDHYRLAIVPIHRRPFRPRKTWLRRAARPRLICMAPTTM
jgi:hypothetical protein